MRSEWRYDPKEWSGCSLDQTAPAAPVPGHSDLAFPLCIVALMMSSVIATSPKNGESWVTAKPSPVSAVVTVSVEGSEPPNTLPSRSAVMVRVASTPPVPETRSTLRDRHLLFQP